MNKQAAPAALLVLVLSLPALGAEGTEDSKPARTHNPSASDLKIEAFLRDAEIVELEDVGDGITQPRRATLRQGQLVARAIFKTVDIEKKGEWSYTSRVEMNFTDKYTYEPAAYRLDRFLGLGLVPVTVLREVDGEKGSLQLWIEDALKVEDARKQDIGPRDVQLFLQRRTKMCVLDALIYNIDRNDRNILITPGDDGFHLIDHSRAFRNFRDLPDTQNCAWEQLAPASPALVERIRALDEDALNAMLGELLERKQVQSILKRKKKLLKALPVAKN